MRTHGDPKLNNLTAEELTASALIFDKRTQSPVESAPKPVAQVPPVAVENSSSAPISAFCLLPNKSEMVENDHQLPSYTAATASAGAGAGTVDLFQDSGAYVQHCLSFVALPAAEYIPQTEMTVQPLSYIHHPS